MRKKLLMLVLAMCLVGTLAACSSSSEEATTTEETTEDTTATTEAKSDDKKDSDSSKKTLVAYFSWSGNTKTMAETINKEVKGDLFEIQPKNAYTSDYDDLLDVAEKELSDDARPEIADKVDNMDQYDTILLGYPNWWNDAPRVILSFLEQYDLKGKKIILFCTSGGSAFGDSTDSIKAVAKDAEVQEGLHISGSSVGSSESEITDWVKGLNLN